MESSLVTIKSKAFLLHFYIHQRVIKKKRKRKIVPRNDTVLFRQCHFARSLPIYKCLEFYRRCELRRPRCRHLMLLEAQGRPT